MCRRLASLLLLALLIASPVMAEEVPYTVEIAVPANPADLARRIDEVSRLRALVDRPPPSRLALERRIEDDRQRIDTVLRAEGYYDGRITSTIEGDAETAVVRLAVDPGPRFTLAAYDLVGAEIALDQIGIELGGPARAKPVEDAADKTVEALRRKGFPFAKATERQVVVDHATRTMRVHQQVDPGPAAVFGAIDISGLETLDEAHVRRRVPWEPGQRFDADLLETLRGNLRDTQLFSQIHLELAETLAPDGSVPLAVRLTERDQRTFGGGVRYSTSEGPGIETFWEHRNLLGSAEWLRASAQWSAVLRNAQLQFRNPDFGGSDQDFLANGLLAEEDTEAYDSRRLEVSAGMEWRLSERWKLTALASLERSVVDEEGVTRSYNLASLPVRGAYDSSDDLLDPTRGGRFQAEVRPFVSLSADGGNFTRLELGQTLYHQISGEPRVVLAGWVRGGSILGAERVEVPAEKRFYAGGGGSIRGYGYQMAGPLDEDDDPIGGRSLLTFGGEARVQVSKSVSIVPFLEGGSVYPDTMPRWGEDALWGAGLGVRYATPVGPVRADIAVPLERRSADDPFQIYLSLGQAF